MILTGNKWDHGFERPWFQVIYHINAMQPLSTGGRSSAWVFRLSPVPFAQSLSRGRQFMVRQVHHERNGLNTVENRKPLDPRQRSFAVGLIAGRGDSRTAPALTFTAIPPAIHLNQNAVEMRLTALDERESCLAAGGSGNARERQYTAPLIPVDIATALARVSHSW